MPPTREMRGYPSKHGGMFIFRKPQKVATSPTFLVDFMEQTKLSQPTLASQNGIINTCLYLLQKPPKWFANILVGALYLQLVSPYYARLNATLFLSKAYPGESRNS